MTICPIAVAVGCQKCPALKICPLKSVLGDAPKSDKATAAAVTPPSKVVVPTNRKPAKKTAAARKKAR